MDKKRKAFWRLVGGISGLITGGGMIFLYKNNLGFIPFILGVILLLYNGKK